MLGINRSWKRSCPVTWVGGYDHRDKDRRTLASSRPARSPRAGPGGSWGPVAVGPLRMPATERRAVWCGGPDGAWLLGFCLDLSPEGATVRCLD